MKSSQKITTEALHTFLNIATAKGYSFSSEEEIVNYLYVEYKLNVSKNDIANLFALEREIEDREHIYRNYLNY